MEGQGRISIDGSTYETHLTPKFSRRRPFIRRDPRRVRAVIPGVVRRRLVEPGQRVTPGTPLLVIEAMKMENEIVSPIAGTVSEVLVEIGQKVVKGELLIDLERST